MDGRQALPQPHPNDVKSRILDDGRYVPGRKGQNRLRREKADELFERHPEVRRRFADDPTTWRFHETQLLHFRDRMVDGFRARYSRELLLLDRRTDARLRQFIGHLRASLPPDSEPMKERVRALSQAVVGALGGNPTGDRLGKRLGKRLDRLGLEPPADLPIGELLGGPCFERRRRGAGVCRHRALLMKYACDALGLADCAVLTGVMVPAGMKEVERKEQQVDHMWNILRVDGSLYLMDCMFFPGDLFAPSDLLKVTEDMQLEYHRIGGGAGVVSLDKQASRSRTAAASRAALASCSLPGGGSLEEESDADDLPAELDGEDEFVKVLQQANLEQLGDVEVARRGPPQPCAACGVELRGQRVQPRKCQHAFHVECLHEWWQEGRCPVCLSSFAY